MTRFAWQIVISYVVLYKNVYRYKKINKYSCQLELNFYKIWADKLCHFLFISSKMKTYFNVCKWAQFPLQLDMFFIKISKNLGECVLFDNRRLLHARTAFGNPSLADGKEPDTEDFRRIAGCYFSWDIVKSKIRLLRDLLSHPDNQNSVWL